MAKVLTPLKSERTEHSGKRSTGNAQIVSIYILWGFPKALNSRVRCAFGNIHFLLTHLVSSFWEKIYLPQCPHSFSFLSALNRIVAKRLLQSTINTFHTEQHRHDDGHQHRQHNHYEPNNSWRHLLLADDAKGFKSRKLRSELNPYCLQTGLPTGPR